MLSGKYSHIDKTAYSAVLNLTNLVEARRSLGEWSTEYVVNCKSFQINYKMGHIQKWAGVHMMFETTCGKKQFVFIVGLHNNNLILHVYGQWSPYIYSFCCIWRLYCLVMYVREHLKLCYITCSVSVIQNYFTFLLNSQQWTSVMLNMNSPNVLILLCNIEINDCIQKYIWLKEHWIAWRHQNE